MDKAIHVMGPMHSIVIMGVSGCGKSSLAQCVAQATGLPLVEGDDYHSAASRDKMARGTPLTDADRAGWLAALGNELQARPDGAVVTCSALKRIYRDQLRQASPGLGFVFMDISKADAQARVNARPAHFFSASLVDNQFSTLESPVGEPGVLRLDATLALAQLQDAVTGWLAAAKESV
jgi:gluconokinase